MKHEASDLSRSDVNSAIYRPNVAAIVTRDDGHILICERAGVDGAWQFPQGGRESGESAEQALVRELNEELSLKPADYRLGDWHGPFRYLFPPGRTKQGYSGQEQFYCQVHLTVAATKIDIETEHVEFQAVRWIAPAEFDLRWLPKMKREVYEAVFQSFFGLSLPSDRSLLPA